MITESLARLAQNHDQLAFLYDMHKTFSDYFNKKKTLGGGSIKPSPMKGTPSKIGLDIEDDEHDLPRVPLSSVVHFSSEAGKVELDKQFPEVKLLQDLMQNNKFISEDELSVPRHSFFERSNKTSVAKSTYRDPEASTGNKKKKESSYPKIKVTNLDEDGKPIKRGPGRPRKDQSQKSGDPRVTPGQGSDSPVITSRRHS